MNKLRHIHSKIGSETAFRIPVSVEDAIAEAVEAYDALDKERSELTARAARLERVSNWVHNGFNDEDDWDRFVEFNKKVYAESLPASLKLLEADIIEKWADGIAEGYGSGCTMAVMEVKGWLKRSAVELRKQAEREDG
jgi:hypothetical protein